MIDYIKRLHLKLRPYVKLITFYISLIPIFGLAFSYLDNAIALYDEIKSKLDQLNRIAQIEEEIRTVKIEIDESIKPKLRATSEQSTSNTAKIDNDLVSKTGLRDATSDIIAEWYYTTVASTDVFAVTLDGNGNEILSAGITTKLIAHSNPTPGKYELRFANSIESCVAGVTTHHKENGYYASSEKIENSREHYDSTRSSLHVSVYDGSGNPVNAGFSILLICPSHHRSIPH